MIFIFLEKVYAFLFDGRVLKRNFWKWEILNVQCKQSCYFFYYNCYNYKTRKRWKNPVYRWKKIGMRPRGDRNKEDRSLSKSPPRKGKNPFLFLVVLPNSFPAKRFPFQTRLFFHFYAHHYLFVLSRTSAYINEMGFPFRIEPPTMSVIQSHNSSFFPIEFVHPIALQMEPQLS
jgi:hypothetical protein